MLQFPSLIFHLILSLLFLLFLYPQFLFFPRLLLFPQFLLFSQFFLFVLHHICRRFLFYYYAPTDSVTIIWTVIMDLEDLDRTLKCPTTDSFKSCTIHFVSRCH